MGLEIVFIAGMMLLTAATHALGLSALEATGHRFEDHPASKRQTVVLLGIVLALLALHVIEILEYAVLYRAIGALPDFETAIYFSGAVYSTIGAVGVELPHEWRVIGSLEGVNGMVMIGWSTAYLFSAWRALGRRSRT